MCEIVHIISISLIISSKGARVGKGQQNFVLCAVPAKCYHFNDNVVQKWFCFQTFKDTFHCPLPSAQPMDISRDGRIKSTFGQREVHLQ